MVHTRHPLRRSCPRTLVVAFAVSTTSATANAAPADADTSAETTSEAEPQTSSLPPEAPPEAAPAPAPAPSAEPTADPPTGPAPAPASSPEPAAEPPAAPAPEPRATYARLGLLLGNGLVYGMWSAKGERIGTAAYHLDLGVGYHFSEQVGLYLLGGGMLGGRVDGVHTTLGRIAIAPGLRKKHFALMPGVGVAFSRLRSGDAAYNDLGLAIPVRAMGMIPLRSKLYLGLGVVYDFALLKGSDIFVNVIGGEVTLGRW